MNPAVDTPTAGPPAGEPAQARVLVVDDEPGVLSALRRALRARGYEPLTAGGGADGLERLAREPVDAIISDMRMPGMDGATFLKAARNVRPTAVRLLLTGHADLTAALKAVNEGEIFRFLTKPWDDDRLVAALDEGLERKRLRAERDRLLALTASQNAELQLLNQGLEARVAERAAEVGHALHQMRQGLAATLHMLGTLVEARAGLTQGCARRVAEHVRRVGPVLGLVGTALQDAVFAAMLADLGKLMLPERLLLQPWAELQASDRRLWLEHPQHAHALLMGNPALQGAACILRAMHERHDGTGTPERLAADAIPLGSRLLAVAVEHESMLAGAIVRARLSPPEALHMLRSLAGTRHDPAVVDAFVDTLSAPPATAGHPRSLATAELRPGMRLAEDLRLREGFALLTAGRVLDATLIRQIQLFEQRAGVTLRPCVHPTDDNLESLPCT
ncbi:MAG: response regulator [Burkholderiaceae bacterium]|jgi:response regulator RpfG family c-di-GMP phosphodiesterase